MTATPDSLEPGPNLVDHNPPSSDAPTPTIIAEESAGHPVSRLAPKILNATDPSFRITSGRWHTAGQIVYKAAGDGSATAQWTITDLPPGLYRVSTNWTPHANRATNTPFTLRDSLADPTPTTVRVNQEQAPSDLTDAGTYWDDLAGPSTPFELYTGTLIVELSDDANEFVLAEQLRIERLDDFPAPADDPATIIDVTDPAPEFQALRGEWNTAGDVIFRQAGVGSGKVRWTFPNLAAGHYRISTTWTPHPNRITDAHYDIFDGTGDQHATPFTVNQELAPDSFTDDGTNWHTLIADFPVTGNTLIVELNDHTDPMLDDGDGSFILAGSVRIQLVTPTSPMPDTAMVTVDAPSFTRESGHWHAATDTPIGDIQYKFGTPTGTDSRVSWTFTDLVPGQYTVATTWLAHNNRATNAPYTLFNGHADPNPLTINANQEHTPDDFNDQGYTWETLTTDFEITNGDLIVELADNADQYVIAGPIWIQRVASESAPIIEARLLNDTGLSDTDGVTFDTTITGAIRDDDTIVSFRAGLDDTPAANYRDVLGTLQPDGTFTFGFSILTEGPHTLHLQAIDDQGNVSATDNLKFTRDPFATERAKFTASDATAQDRFGFATAVDENVAIVGAPFKYDYERETTGAAYLFDVTTGSQLAALTASDTPVEIRFGYSVAISGTTVIVGAVSTFGYDQTSGAAYLFDISDPANPIELAILTATDAAPDDRFGSSVAISGNTVIVGADFDVDEGRGGQYTGSGSAYLFDISDPSNPVELVKLTGSEIGIGDNFGSSMAISGHTLIIGARREDYDGGSNSGGAYLFDISDPANPVELAKLTASDAAFGDGFGNSVAISGNTAIVGALFDADEGKGSFSGTGAAYLFDISNPSSPIELAKVTASNPKSSDRFGLSVAIRDNTVIVGAVGAKNIHGSNSGSVYVFDITDPANVVEFANLITTDAARSDYLGSSVTVSGTSAIIGASLDAREGDGSYNGEGSVYIFEIPQRPTVPLLGLEIPRITAEIESYGITGVITPHQDIVAFRAGFDDMPLADFVDVLEYLEPDGTFLIRAHRFNSIYGSSFTDGIYTLHLQAIDRHGNVSEINSNKFRYTAPDYEFRTTTVFANFFNVPSSFDPFAPPTNEVFTYG